MVPRGSQKLAVSKCALFGTSSAVGFVVVVFFLTRLHDTTIQRFDKNPAVWLLLKTQLWWARGRQPGSEITKVHTLQFASRHASFISGPY